MKRIIAAVAISVSMLLSPSVFAGNEESCESKGAHLPPAEYVAHMKSCLAQASSTANVEAVALQQKLAYCVSNSKNEGLNCSTYVGCSEQKHYVASCMNDNQAQVQYASINRRIAPASTDTAGTDYNKILQEAPTAAGPK